jgi:hypothetical protein
MSHTSGSGGEYSISTKRGREVMVMTNKVLKEKEIRGEVEEKGRCHPLLKQINLCNSGLVGFTAPRGVTEAAVGAAGAHRCSSTSFNVMPCRYR